MSCISWNSRGLGNPLGIQTLSDLVRKQDPDFLFLQETRLHSKVMERLKFKLGFYGCLAVSCEGRSGGVALYWKNNFTVEIQSFSRFHVHAKVTEEGENSESWWLTGIYGKPDVSRRYESWDLLRSIKVPSDKRWLLMGDFNEIMSNDEKSGGRSRSESQMKAFKDVIEECHLHDLGFEGNPFTWCNRREGGQSISERLDRFFSNFKWHSLYPMATVIHGIVAYSDHVPIILKLTERVQRQVGRRLFRFEAMWVEAPDCKQIVQRAWRGVNGRRDLGTVLKKIQCCGEKLTVWNKASFGHVQRSLKVAQEKLQLAHQMDPLSHDKQKLQEAI
ncbi:uncharacterized protein LOC122278633 [Carya illinoinensis]|uniref:uncharacterized protein LOC122278633 n=1 Tax=Carya illinoinensis TaxID=32201 RepID=UPI001C723ADA|nr:uncharacterized protein LOC122278633 [Carya illinoinensis]